MQTKAQEKMAIRARNARKKSDDAAQRAYEAEEKWHTAKCLASKEYVRFREVEEKFHASIRGK